MPTIQYQFNGQTFSSEVTDSFPTLGGQRADIFLESNVYNYVLYIKDAPRSVFFVALSNWMKFGNVSNPDDLVKN